MQAVLYTFFFQFFIARLWIKNIFVMTVKKIYGLLIKIQKFSCLFNLQAAEYNNQISQMIAWKCVAKGCGIKGQGNELQIAKSG